MPPIAPVRPGYGGGYYGGSHYYPRYYYPGYYYPYSYPYYYNPWYFGGGAYAPYYYGYNPYGWGYGPSMSFGIYGAFPYGYAPYGGSFGLSYTYIETGGGSGGGGGGRSSRSDERPPERVETVRSMGDLRLRISPKHATVYIDGALVGTVDEFDGLRDHLEIEAGLHQLEIRADGYEHYRTEVTVAEGRTITERAKLKKR